MSNGILVLSVANAARSRVAERRACRGPDPRG
jgi:hypothetical protein